jgi:hypothetical protein
MSNIIVQDITPRVQYTAGGGSPTVFTYPFPIFALTDIDVYVTPNGTTPNDVTNILVYNIGYTVVNNVAPAVGGTVTLTTGLNAGDVVTIARDAPDVFLNNYLDGGLFLATDVNTDFDSTVMLCQQDKMYDKVLGLHYNVSSQPVTIVDNVIPILPANCVWMKNNANNQIVAVLFGAAAGGGAPVILPAVANAIAIFNNAGGVIQAANFLIPAIDGNYGDAVTTNGAGQLQMATIPGLNRLYNGSFQIWQRGAGGNAIISVAASTTKYTADRWQLQTNANQACTVTQTAGALSGSYVAFVQRTAAQTGVGEIGFAQSLTRDMSFGVAGRLVTVSFNAAEAPFFSSALSVLRVRIVTGTGNSDISVFSNFTNATNILDTTITLTQVSQIFRLTSTVAAGATVTQMAVIFSYTPIGTAGATDGFYLGQAQLEVAAKATPFQQLSFAQELSNCHYFYAKSFNYTIAPAQNAGLMTGETAMVASLAGAFTNYSSTVYFPTITRANGSGLVTFFNPGAANAQARDETAGADCTSTTYLSTKDRGFYLSYVGNAVTSIGNQITVHWTYDSDIV